MTLVVEMLLLFFVTNKRTLKSRFAMKQNKEEEEHKVLAGWLAAHKVGFYFAKKGDLISDRHRLWEFTTRHWFCFVIIITTTSTSTSTIIIKSIQNLSSHSLTHSFIYLLWFECVGFERQIFGKSAKIRSSKIKSSPLMMDGWRWMNGKRRGGERWISFICKS